MSLSRMGRKPTYGMLGKKMSEESRKKLSEAHKGVGRKDSRKWMIGRKLPIEIKEKIGAALCGRPMRDEVKGSNHHLWKGGLTEENQMIRNSLNYRIWRKSVYVRDAYTCQDCGKMGEGDLNAHHIKPFSLFPELRFAIDNGRTLCEVCHRKTESYGRGVLKITEMHYS